MPVLQYYEQMGMVAKIDGSRPKDDVWADSQQTVTSYERRFAPAPPRACYLVSVHATDEARARARRPWPGRPSPAPAAGDTTRPLPHRRQAYTQAYTSDVAARIAADVARKWGAGAVSVEGQAYIVEASLKAFDLEALRDFD